MPANSNTKVEHQDIHPLVFDHEHILFGCYYDAAAILRLDDIKRIFNIENTDGYPFGRIKRHVMHHGIFKEMTFSAIEDISFFMYGVEKKRKEGIKDNLDLKYLNLFLSWWDAEARLLLQTAFFNTLLPHDGCIANDWKRISDATDGSSRHNLSRCQYAENALVEA